MNQGPAQKVLYPNVTSSTMSRFEKELDTWFGRKNIPIWITEYGNETKPGEPSGVTEAQQAAYVTQAIAMAKKDTRVPMFIWFVFRDSGGSPWQSGVYRTSGAAKPAAPEVELGGEPVDRVNGKVTVKGGTANPPVIVYCAICARTTGRRAWSSSGRNLPRRAGAYRRPEQSRPRLRLHDHGPSHRPACGEGPDLQGRDRREHRDDRAEEADDHDRGNLDG